MFVFQYPWEIIKKAHSLGLLNGHIPESCGKLPLIKNIGLASMSVYCVVCTLRESSFNMTRGGGG